MPACYRGEQDEILVVRALVGDMAAYDELVRRFRCAVVLVAQEVVGCRQTAEDVAQDALLLAFKALPQLTDPRRFGGWLCAIARHRARRVAQREGPGRPAVPTDLDRAILERSRELNPDPATVFARKLESALLSQAVNDLPHDHRTVVLLHYYEGWPIRRIAAFLLLPETTVKWRLHRARWLLRQGLGKP
jgi:RNA polymerase sigma-70 factor, ECF subfamily